MLSPSDKWDFESISIVVEHRKFVDFMDKISEIRRRFCSSTENGRVISHTAREFVCWTRAQVTRIRQCFVTWRQTTSKRHQNDLKMASNGRQSSLRLVTKQWRILTYWRVIHTHFLPCSAVSQLRGKTMSSSWPSMPGCSRMTFS